MLVSPYSWLPQYTAPERWVGGYTDSAGVPVMSQHALGERLGPKFTLVHSSDMPFLIREHLRKFQWGCSHATVWKYSG